MNHSVVTSVGQCVKRGHINSEQQEQEQVTFPNIIGSHLSDLGWLHFSPYGHHPISLYAYNVPMLWDLNRITQFNQYSSDCDDDSLVKPLCDYGSSECFSADRICTFERDIYGDPVHCSDTEHLRYCASHECPDAFKCNGSYCIPVHMVCDTILDCPDGEDEAGCDELVVRGMFRYGYTYSMLKLHLFF